MKNPFTGLFRARDKPGDRHSTRDAVSAATTCSFGSSSAGKSVTPRNAIQVSVVYACVRVIAEAIASLPFGVFQETPEGSLNALMRGDYKSRMEGYAIGRQNG